MFVQPQTPNNQPPAQSPIPEPKAPDNPYDFILNPPQPQKNKQPFSGFKKTPILIGAGLGVMLLIILVIAMASGGGSSTTTQLASLSAEQQEIIRVSDIALKSSKNSQTLATATTVKASITSDQNKTIELLTAQGGKLAKGQLASKQSSKTDEALTSAQQSNTFDQAYNDYLKTSLENYQKKLTLIFKDGGPKTKAFADSAYKSSQIITASL